MQFVTERGVPPNVVRHRAQCASKWSASPSAVCHQMEFVTERSVPPNGVCHRAQCATKCSVLRNTKNSRRFHCMLNADESSHDKADNGIRSVLTSSSSSSHNHHYLTLCLCYIVVSTVLNAIIIIGEKKKK